MSRAHLVLALVLAACDAPAPELPVAEASAARRSPAPSRPPGHVAVVVATGAVDVAPPDDGVIDRLWVHAGDPVLAGQPLAVLDVAEASSALAMAEAGLAAAEAARGVAELAIDEAVARHDVELRLETAGAGRREDAAAATRAVARARAEHRRARAEADEQRTHRDALRRRLQRTVVVAPFSGTVGQVYRHRGAVVGPGAPLVRIVGDTELALRAAIPAELAAQVGPGTPLQAEIETRSPPVCASVQRVATEVDPASHRVFVDAAIDPLDAGGLRPGLAAEVWLTPCGSRSTDTARLPRP